MFTIALSGNPNTGKSTLFNALTGSHQHTGNWPGKTVEQKIGYFKYKDKEIEIVDLPGTYSLTAVSSEEVVTRDYIVEEKPEATIVIADATNLERNLYLVLQVMELTDNVVVALNMTDQLASKGMSIDVDKLSTLLGVPVVSITALKKQGIPELLDAVLKVRKEQFQPVQVTFEKEVEEQISKVETSLKQVDGYRSRWLAIKLLEQDPEVIKMLKGVGNEVAVREAQAAAVGANEKPEIAIASSRYELISKIVKQTITYNEKKKSITDKIDDVVTHKYFGIPILFLLACFTLWAIYTIAGPIGGFFEMIFDKLIAWASAGLSGSPWWLQGLLVEGVLTGVQQLFVFMFGVLTVFFAIYGILEDVGYLAREAFVIDRVMCWLGLPGKAFLTIFAGYGCSIPGIMGARIIDDENDHIVTAMVVPFIPCAARIAVITSIVPIFFGFGFKAALVTVGIFLLSLLTVALVAILLKKTLLKGEKSTLVMELPDYHPPLVSNILRTTWDRTYSAMSKALLIFVPFSILIWVLFNFPAGNEITWGMQIGQFLDPVGAVIGLVGKDMTGFLFSYPAKELSLLYLGLAYGVEGAEGVLDVIGSVWTPLQALSYLAFLTLYAPCLATVAAMLKEIGAKWTILNVLISLCAGFFFAALTYWGGMALVG
ncbi:MAG: ferrous iron transport protein B [Chloroflexi bacterium]|nr:ferrous iron transport protein B [Chloroflexota bacterium]